MNTTDRDIIASTPELMDAYRTALVGIELAKDAGVIDDNTGPELLKACFAFGFYSVLADKMLYSPHREEADALIEAFGKMVYRDAQAVHS